MKRVLALCLVLAGCASKSGSLLVVTIATPMPGATLSSVHAHVVATTRSKDVDLTFPGDTTTPATFGIDFPPDISGSISVDLDGGALGTGSGSTALAHGRTAMLTIMLGGASGGDLGVSDLGASDLAGVDLAGADLAGADLSMPPADLSGAGDLSHVVGWAIESTGSASLNSVWGADGAVFAVGANGTILRSTGNGTWTAQTSGTTQTLNGIWGSPGGFLYAVGNAGTVLYSNGSGVWQPQTAGTGTMNLYCVWGSADNNVYAGGASGAMIHSTGGGASWTAQTTGFSDDFLGLWGTSDGAHIYGANNSAGAVFLSTGNGSWTFQASSTTSVTTSATGSGTTVYIAATAVGTLTSSTGNGTWTAVNAMSAKELWGVFAAGAGDVWAVGDSGTVTHLSGGTWTAQTTGSAADLRAVWADANNVYAVGLNGAILHRH